MEDFSELLKKSYAQLVHAQETAFKEWEGVIEGLARSVDELSTGRVRLLYRRIAREGGKSIYELYLLDNKKREKTIAYYRFHEMGYPIGHGSFLADEFYERESIKDRATFEKHLGVLVGSPTSSLLVSLRTLLT